MEGPVVNDSTLSSANPSLSDIWLSHSSTPTKRHLSPEARREKISQRMKILQYLVPGCNKVIGNALLLDEIINYIHSLQRQIQFLSMKLEAVNSRLSMSSTIECFPSKEVQVGTQPFDISGVIFGSQAARGYAQGSQPEWLHMRRAGGFEKAT